MQCKQTKALPGAPQHVAAAIRSPASAPVAEHAQPIGIAFSSVHATCWVSPLALADLQMGVLVLREPELMLQEP